MFKKSRRKIVAAIMSVLVFLWVGTLGVIYTSSYIEMSRRNEQMLKVHTEMYTITQPFEEVRPPNLPMPGGNPGFESSFAESPMFQLSTFYTVAMTYEGETIEIKNNQQNLHSDSDLEQLAEKVFKSNRTKGTINNLAFYKADKSGYTLVAFMDNTVINENAITLFRYTLIFGAIALVIFFFLSQFLAKKIVKPLEESYKKQKQFISDAGHELKTPVSVVSANAELLSREIGENQWLENILYENERMVKVALAINKGHKAILEIKPILPGQKILVKTATAQDLRCRKISSMVRYPALKMVKVLTDRITQIVRCKSLRGISVLITVSFNLYRRLHFQQKPC